MTDYDQDEQWFQNKGWHFDRNDDFVDKHGNMFDFKTQSDYYEFIHDKLQVMLHKRLVQEYGFKMLAVPWEPTASASLKAQGRIPRDCPRVFVTQDVFVNPKVLIIVQGLGKVTPGQWARKLFTNGQKGQFDCASQIPYIERALHLGWAIILCDPNRPELSPSASSTSTSGSMSMWLRGGDTRGRSRSDHVRRVWEDLIRPYPSKCVMFVAFSAGTVATLDLFDTCRKEFMRRVKAVVLLDGADGSSRYSRMNGAWLYKHTRSFSQKGSDSRNLRNGEEVNTNDHDSVPGVAVSRVFEFLEWRHSQFIAQLPDEQYHWVRSLYHRRPTTVRRGGSAAARLLSSFSDSSSSSHRR
ncbi:hypothetical protein BGZ96_006340 [Linnemannia gamsii]|uniref:Arb2 domain-containing protein n=1 Tax=Linnemannia gamsii TaxID=64522 RepID=A0ABQ7K468_9FUNG|nr:hypothetical protein BGZ96_006340 [Linnemannia gamsii]